MEEGSLSLFLSCGACFDPCFPQVGVDRYSRSSTKMALQAVVFQQDLFGCNMREMHIKGGEIRGVLSQCDVRGAQGGRNLSLPEVGTDSASVVGTGTAAGRRKRRRTRSCKNQEEVENQRMTHIAVERNRRKQMNQYLAVLRSLIPASYLHRGDQASVIGGAVNFVKELEQLVQSLEARKRIKQRSNSAPFANFFTFPQYSTRNADEAAAEQQSSVADIEVTMVESHANLKVLAQQRPKQLLKMVVGLHLLHLTTLHLNVTTIDAMVLYSFSLKVEDECHFTCVDEIAAAVHQMVGKIEEEAASYSDMCSVF
ncbi:Sodium:sulfate symporter transmembrane region [Musa troglodytarum]|uniref:Sodium:sulfate symporter transmembrane region n=1 Tax=Musa troglodytarum TaxID=320322 RepID=A0A9E7FRT2_9LILI|nr:Sodium:sulfate symporter transmembrane region [Musa troglodytarum]